MKILIVDDSIYIIEILLDGLARPGHEIRTAFDGSEALGKAAKESFDLIISDVKMPFMGGIELGYRLREAHLDTPIIYFSAEVDGFEGSRGDLAAIGKATYVENKDFKKLFEIVSEISSSKWKSK